MHDARRAFGDKAKAAGRVNSDLRRWVRERKRGVEEGRKGGEGRERNCAPHKPFGNKAIALGRAQRYLRSIGRERVSDGEDEESEGAEKRQKGRRGGKRETETKGEGEGEGEKEKGREVTRRRRSVLSKSAGNKRRKFYNNAKKRK